MRYLKFLVVIFLVLLSCEEEVFKNSEATMESAEIDNCADVINRLEICLDIHEGALGYLKQSCSEETVIFVKENVDSCEKLVDYFIEM